MVMFLHRYFSSYAALETLKDAKLLASRISGFNDPFEFLYVCDFGKLKPEKARQLIRSQRNNPALLLNLLALNQQSPKPLTDKEIKKRLDKNEPSMVAHLVNKWPEIAKETELTFISQRQIIDKELRAVCFSNPSRVKSLDEILLWSHYAKKHEGIRIGFEFPDGIKDPFEIMKMTYQKNRVAVDFSFGVDPGLAYKALEECAKVKSEAWEYEQEFRLFTEVCKCGKPKEIKHADSTSTLESFLDFNREWIKSVDFGVLCPDTEIQRVITLLKADYPNAVARKAEFHKTEYALKYKQVQ